MSFLIKVFKTNIEDEKTAKKIILSLSSILPQCGINFDLDDSDNILRIVAEHPAQIDMLVSYIRKEGFSITLLD